MISRDKSGYQDCFDLFDAAEQELLLRAPAIVFMFVAGADGDIDQRERRVCANLLSNVAGEVDDLFPAIALRLRSTSNGGEFWESLFAQDPVVLLTVLTQAAHAASLKMPPEKSRAFVQDLLQYGRMIAEASGGSLFGLGNRVSAKEEKILGILTSALEAGLLGTLPENDAAQQRRPSPPAARKTAQPPAAELDFTAAQRLLQIRLHGPGWFSEDKTDLICEERLPGVMCALVIAEDPVQISANTKHQAVHYVTKQQLAAWGQPLSDLMKIGIDHSYAPELEVHAMDQSAMPGLKVLPDSRYSGQQIFLLERHPQLVGPHGAIVAVPGRNYLLSLPIASSAYFEQIPAFHRLAQDIYRDVVEAESIAGFYAITSNIFLYRHGKLVQINHDLLSNVISGSDSLNRMIAQIDEEVGLHREPAVLH